MKVYQLKIMIKNTKPPIWRRCIIPAGITYAQLSILLNEIVGWKERAEYEFEFYHRALQLREDDGIHAFRPSWKYDLLKANETYIDECFDQEEWFSYHLKSGYSHRVTIEKVYDNDGIPCPSVEKYKGECPESESSSYDLRQINAVLKERYYVSYGEKADFRKQEELYDGIDCGEYGLSGKVNPKNDREQLYKSANHLLQEFSDQLSTVFKERARIYAEQNPDEEMDKDENIGNDLIRFLMDSVTAEENKLQSKVYSDMLHKREPDRTLKLSDTLLKDALDIYSKDSLKDYANELNLLHYASLNKSELREKIANELLRPSVMRKKMSRLTDKQMEVFEKIVNEGQLYRFTEEEESIIVKLHNLDYIIRYEDGFIEVPIDVKAVYKLINTSEYQKERGQIAWLNSCLLIASLLYAKFPISVLRRLYRRKPGYRADRKELIEVFDKIPEEDRTFYLEDDVFILKGMKNRYELYLQKQQMLGDDYYIPSLEEIEEYAEHEYFPSDPAYQALREFLRRQDGIEFDEIEEVLYTVNIRLSRGWSFEEVSEDIHKELFAFPDVKSKKEFASLVEAAAEHSRLLIFRGYKYSEMIQQDIAYSGSTLDAALVQAPFGTRQKAQPTEKSVHVKKIYPNDPCPCGSGKKYKKCCGRNSR